MNEGQSTGSKIMGEYRKMSESDKNALHALKAEAQVRLGVEIKISDMLAAVTPGIETPAFLKAA